MASPSKRSSPSHHIHAEERRRARYEAAAASDWRFEQFFNLLGLSPSYLLAHRRAVGEQKQSAIDLADGFALVEETYGLCGNVWDVGYLEWWSECGQYVFNVAVPPEIEVFGHWERMQELKGQEYQQLNDRIDEYLRWERPSLASPPTVLMAVPIHPNRSELLRAFSEAIDGLASTPQDNGPAQIALLRNKVREETVRDCWRAAVRKIAAPDDPLREIGDALGVTGGHIGSEADARVVTIMTSRMLKRAYTLAENAARGQFPSFDPVSVVERGPAFEFHRLQELYGPAWFAARLSELPAVRERKIREASTPARIAAAKARARRA